MLPFLHYINVLKSVLSKQTSGQPSVNVIPHLDTAALFCSHSEFFEEPSCSLFFQLPHFFFSLLTSDFSSYCFCETTLARISGNVLIIEYKGNLFCGVVFNLFVVPDVDGCSLLRELWTTLFCALPNV